MRIYTFLALVLVALAVAWSSRTSTAVTPPPSEDLLSREVTGKTFSWPSVQVDVVPEPISELASRVEKVIQLWPAAVVPHLDPTTVSELVARAVMTEDCGGEPKFTGEDGRKRCLWAEGWNSDKRKALLLAALAYFEGARFARYVAEGRCHDWMHLVYEHKPLPDDAYVTIGGKQYNLLRFGDCDGGRAWSLWQIRPDALERPKLEGPELRDSEFAASVAVGIVRLSMRWRGDLCGYTGESPESGCPKSRERMNWARKALHLPLATWQSEKSDPASDDDPKP